MKKLLVTGASGFLGWNLCQRAQAEWDVLGTFMAHPVHIDGVDMTRVDLTDYRSLKEFITNSRPQAVIHLAAVSDANFCQENQNLSRKINTEAPINLAGLCSDVNIPLLFASSDLIFDGLNAPYSEGDEPSPVSTYGEQKVRAEKGMKERYPETVLCRVPLMYGNPGPAALSFIQPMIRALKSGEPLNLFVDEFRSPLSGRDAAEGLMIALGHLPPVIHLGGPERISRYRFGEQMTKVFDFPMALLKPCRQKDMNLSAPRPPDVSLDSTMAGKMGFRPRPVMEALKELKEELL